MCPILYDVYNNSYYSCVNGQLPPPPPLPRYDIGTTEIVDLGPGESISVVLPWNIVGVPPHNYTLWAEAEAFQEKLKRATTLVVEEP